MPLNVWQLLFWSKKYGIAMVSYKLALAANDACDIQGRVSALNIKFCSTIQMACKLYTINSLAQILPEESMNLQLLYIAIASMHVHYNPLTNHNLHSKEIFFMISFINLHRSNDGTCIMFPTNGPSPPTCTLGN